MTAAPSITAGPRLVTYPFSPASCRARSMVFWFSSQVAPVTFRNRVRVTGDLPAAAFSARAICAVIVLLSRWLRLNDHWQATRRCRSCFPDPMTREDSRICPPAR